MKRKLQINYLLLVSFLITGACFFYSCNHFQGVAKKNSTSFYYYGEKKIEITIPGDTLGLLLTDKAPGTGESSQKNFTVVKKLIDSILIMEGFTSAGLLTNDGTILLFTPAGGNNTVAFLEKEAGRLKNKYKSLILNAGYLARISETKAPIIITNELILEFKTGITDTLTNKFFIDNGLIVKQKSPFVPNQYTVSVTDSSPVDALKMTHLLKNNPQLKSADINLIYLKKFTSIIPADGLFNRQWHLVNTGSINNTIKDADIDADLAWDFTMGSENTIIAVIDDGFDVNSECIVEFSQ